MLEMEEENERLKKALNSNPIHPTQSDSGCSDSEDLFLLEEEYRAWRKKARLESSGSLRAASKVKGKDETVFELSPNGQLRIGREFLQFGGIRQFSLVKQLLATALTGKPAKISIILDASGFSPSVDTLNKAFKNNPSWPVLKKYLVQQQGFVRLAFEAENENGADSTPKPLK